MARFRTPHPMLIGATLFVLLAGALLAASYLSATTGPLAERRGGRLADVRELQAIAADSEGGVFLATDEGLAHGPDAEGAWHRLGKEHHNFTAVAVDPLDGMRLWLGGHAERTGLENPDLGVRVSHDGGKTLEYLARAERLVTSLAASAGQPGVLWAVEPEGARVLRSEDGGATWTVASEGVPFVRGIAAGAADPQVAFVAGEGVRRTVDGGVSWAVVRAGSAFAVAADAVDPDRVYVAAAEGMERSVDGGATWERVPLAPTDGPVVALAAHPVEGGVLFGATVHGEVYRSDDAGSSWMRLR